MTWTDAGIFSNVVRNVPLSSCNEIVYAGVLIPRKGIHILIDAFSNLQSRHPESTLSIIGTPQNSEYTDRLHKQVVQLDLVEKVKFYDNVPQRELSEAFARSRVLVLPSFSEGLGRVLVEAMLCGTPVIGTRVGGISDLIHDGHNGYLIPSDDIPALTEALYKVFDDPQIELMGIRAKEFAATFFSPEKYKQGYQELFEIADQILSNASQ
jgi:glycosyltransferase involved in cell wall biosynthesis